MAMVEQMAPEPEPESLLVGYLQLVFDGSAQDYDAEIKARQFMALISDNIKRIREDFSFNYEGRTIRFSEFYLEFDELYDGSIIARYKIIGNFLFGTYTAVAAYPTFKDGVEEIRQDFRSAIEYVIAHARSHEEPRNIPRSFELYFRSEEEIAEDLDAKGHSAPRRL